MDIRKSTWRLTALAAALSLGLGACGGGTGPQSAASAPGKGGFALGGTLSSLGVGRSLQWQLNGADATSATGDGAIAFASGLTTGTAYAITVSAQPRWQTCTVANGSGTIASGDVTNVAITCADDVAEASTFAGSGTAGLLGGVGAAAELHTPRGVAVDASGNAYVADTANNVIRKITPAGLVTIFAGNGTAGLVNGDASTAEFSAPTGVAVDASGDVYVADSGNNAIRMLATTGFATTVAGTGAAGFGNGASASATFSDPMGVAVDKAGNVYVADTGNNAIREISTSGTVSTLAGSGTAGYVNDVGAAAEFSGPQGVAVNPAGTMAFVADTGNNVIRNITLATRSVTLYVGDPTVGGLSDTTDPAGARFRAPTALTFDGDGYFYVADTGNNAVRRVDPAGSVTTVAGNGTAGLVNGSTAPEFNTPEGVGVASSGALYVGDAANNVVRLLTPTARN